jgi:2-haloacid dehalogenase
VSPVRVLLFDVFGTLVDWRGSLIAAAEESGRRSGVTAEWAEIVDDWRRAYPPAMAAVRDGDKWCDLDMLQRATLDDVLARHRVNLPADERQSLVLGWRRLHPWPDTAEGLRRLRRDHVTATLSNGHIALLVDLLRFGDLQVDAVLSAELARSYKPDPVVYLTALQLLGVEAAEAGMVAAHPTDLEAAAALGLRPIFIRRQREWGAGVRPASAPTLDGLVVAEDLVELAAQLAGDLPSGKSG